MESWLTPLNIILIVLTIIQSLVALPLWGWVMKMRDTVIKVGQLEEAIDEQTEQLNLVKKELLDKIKALEQNIQVIDKAYVQHLIETKDMFGKVNVALARVESTIVSFTRALEDVNREQVEMRQRFYKELDDLRNKQ